MKPFNELRFWLSIDSAGGPGSCWPWRLSRMARRGGYGQVRYGDKTLKTHRVAYELAHGPIPGGLFVCHRCDNPPCCNPDHLFLGTTADNTRDMRSKGRGYDIPTRKKDNSLATRLTFEDAQAIRLLHSSGMRNMYLAVAFNTSRANIHRITSMKTWVNA